MTSNDDQKSVLYTDVCLLLFLALIGIMAILMALTGHVLLNTIFLFCTLAVLLITYFFGIIASLITNLGFIARHTVFFVRRHQSSHGDFSFLQGSKWPLLRPWRSPKKPENYYLTVYQMPV